MNLVLPPGWRFRQGWFGKLILQRYILFTMPSRVHGKGRWVDATVHDLLSTAYTES